VLLTLDPDAGGGGGLAVQVDRLAGVDPHVGRPHAVNVQCHNAELVTRFHSRSCARFQGFRKVREAKVLQDFLLQVFHESSSPNPWKTKLV
jgi:hypothetical protein